MLQKNLKIDENASLGIKIFLEIFLYYLIKVCSWIFILNMLGNNMYYFDEVTLTTNVLRKKVV